MSFAPGSVAEAYRHFIEDRAGVDETVYINGCQFHINPTSFRDTTEWLYQEKQTWDGYVRFNYNRIKPPQIQMDGHTGIAGVDGINDMEAKFRPLVGKTDALVEFRAPLRFGKKRLYIHINSMETSMSDSMHLYYLYTIQATVYPRATPPPAVKVVAPNVVIGLPLPNPAT